MTIMDLNDFRVYRRAMDVAGTIWSEVAGWHAFERDTLGWQLVQAADSVAANISEGHGRYHFGERRQFCYYARGSIHKRPLRGFRRLVAVVSSTRNGTEICVLS
jgi:hypothetical protein